MTATIELSDRLVKKAKRFSGISDFQQLMHKMLESYIDGTEYLNSLIHVSEKIDDTDSFGEGYDPRV